MSYYAILQQFHLQLIEIGRLGIPLMGLADVNLLADLPPSGYMSGYVEDAPHGLVTFGVRQCNHQLIGVSGTAVVSRQRILMGIAHHRLYRQVGIGIGLIEVSYGRHIVNPAATGHRFQCHITVDTTQRPVIVGISLIARIYLTNTNRQHIFLTSLNGRCHIKGEGGIATVVTAYPRAVKPDLSRVPHATEMQ